MASQDRTAERRIARIASRAWGIVTRSELRAIGLSRDEIAYRLDCGLLIPQYRGVYRVGHAAPSLEADYLAAVKACGEGALLSHLAAAHLYALTRRRPARPQVITRTERRIVGIETSRARRGLHPADRASFRRIPVTSVARTIVDASSLLPEDDLARACHEAGVRYGTTPRQVKAVLERRPNAPGSKRLWRVINGDEPVVLSRLEKRFIELLVEHDLPLPVTNRPTGGLRVDCRWAEQRLTVELDSYTFHNSRYAWEQGRLREREARRRGDEFRRYTWRDVFEQPREMLADLRLLLATR